MSSSLYNGINTSRVPECLPQITPIPFHKPEIKINTSSSSNTLIPYKFIRISIPYLDYSSLKVNKLAPQITTDPRLYKPSRFYNGINISESSCLPSSNDFIS
jgi:hypothetical protein